VRRLHLFVGWTLWAAPCLAQADVLPDPAVPEGWDQNPPPQPVAPPDKELPVIALFVVMAACGGLMLRRGPDVAHG